MVLHRVRILSLCSLAALIIAPGVVPADTGQPEAAAPPLHQVSADQQEGPILDLLEAEGPDGPPLDLSLAERAERICTFECAESSATPQNWGMGASSTAAINNLDAQVQPVADSTGPGICSPLPYCGYTLVVDAIHESGGQFTADGHGVIRCLERECTGPPPK
jgi:hypothetical protein